MKMRDHGHYLNDLANSFTIESLFLPGRNTNMIQICKNEDDQQTYI